MAYQLGVDLGTTYTAAAVVRADGRPEMVTLGDRSAAIPSVILLREDETILVGDAASRRGVTQPDRVAREFKRRLGDTVPLFLGGVPYSAESLLGKLLRWVVQEVSTREGGPPERVAVCHPANWGPYKIDLLRNAVRLADLSDVVLLTEPQAAAVSYASQERVETGSTVAVYDLGGGTFDAAVLRKTEAGFEHLGQPEGIERLGGVDFDAAVFAHVQRAVGSALTDLDGDDPTVMAAVARLRGDCADAKEALSVDSDTSIPVLLPSVQTEVRLTRGELESMIRPALADSVDALRRALRSAAVSPDEISVVLLVGGSSRIPLVSQLVGGELGRPVAVDAHPKHAIALGAALAAAGRSGGQAAGAAPAPAAPAPPPTPPAPAPASAPTAPPVAAAPAPAAPAPAHAAPPAAPPPASPPPAPPAAPPPAPPAYAPPPTRVDTPAVAAVTPPTPTAPAPAPVHAVPAAPPAAPHAAAAHTAPVASPPGAETPAWMAPAPPVPPHAAAPDVGARDAGGRSTLVVLGGLVVLMLLGAAVYLATRPDDDGGGGSATVATLPEGCPEGAVVCIGQVGADDDGVGLFVGFDTTVSLGPERPALLFFDDLDVSQIGAGQAGRFRIWTDDPPYKGFTLADAADAVGRGATQVCIVVADADLEVDAGSGNCFGLPSDLTGG